MPVWTLEELQIANRFCLKEKAFDERTIEERFNIIGGCARYVLRDEEDYQEQEEAAFQATGSVTSVEELKKLIEGMKNFNPEKQATR